MQLEASSTLPSYLTVHPKPHELLLGAIKVCNLKKKEGCYLTPELKLARKTTGSEKGASLGTVIRTFNRVVMDAKLSELSEQFIQEAKVQIVAYIDLEAGVSVNKKNELREGVLSVLEVFIRQKLPLKSLQQILEADQLSRHDVVHLGFVLSSMAIERAAMFRLQLLILGFYYFTQFAKGMKECCGIYLERPSGELSFDWSRFETGSIDEFASTWSMAESRLDDDRSRFYNLLGKASDRQRTLWGPIVAIDEMATLVKSFDLTVKALQMDHSGYLKISKEVRGLISLCSQIIEGVGANTKSDYYLRRCVTKEHLFDEARGLFESYQAGQDKLEALYELAYRRLSHVADVDRPIIYDHSLEKQPPTPAEFRAVPLARFKRAGCPFQFAEIVTRFSQMTHADAKQYAFSLFVNEFFAPSETYEIWELFSSQDITPVSIFEAFSQEEAVVPSVEALAVGDTQKKGPPRRKMNKLIKKAQPESPAVEKAVKVKVHKAKKEPESLFKEDLTLAPRVRDWYQKHPAIIQNAAYSQMSQEQIEEVKFLHTYPMIITKLMRQYIAPRKWRSHTHHKTNNLYTCVGTIHRYQTNEPPLQGYFTDCFDLTTDELYHHYFCKSRLSHLLMRLLQGGVLYSEEEERGWTDEKAIFPPAALLEEHELYERFSIRITEFSIVVDDTFKKIRYTLCLPI